MASYGSGSHYMDGIGGWGLLTVFLMNRAASGKWLDSAHLTAKPIRTLSWFLIGASISAMVNVAKMREAGYDAQTYQLNRRVSQNEHAHAILKNVRFHLQTRKMSVWDANPN